MNGTELITYSRAVAAFSFLGIVLMVLYTSHFSGAFGLGMRLLREYSTKVKRAKAEMVTPGLMRDTAAK